MEEHFHLSNEGQDNTTPSTTQKLSKVVIKTSINGVPELKAINNKYRVGGPNTPRTAYSALKTFYQEYVDSRVIKPEIEGLFGDRDDINPEILEGLITGGKVHIGPKSMQLLRVAIEEKRKENLQLERERLAENS